MNKVSILIIDDEPDNFDVIETLLSVGVEKTAATTANLSDSNQDYQLHYAASGKEAIALLDTFKPDLILLDVMMPDMDGIEVCQRIKAIPQWHPVPIVMITALTAKEDLARCLKSGADDFISKPVNGLELRARVHSMLRIKKQYDDQQALLKLQEDMVNMVVHDLRNPLTNILLGLELLQSVNYPEQKRHLKLNRIYSSAQKLQQLIDDLLSMAMLQSGKVTPNCKSVDLCELVQSSVSSFEAIAAEKNQVLVVKLPEDCDREVSIDFAMMHRTLDNLLSNAIKFSPDDSQIMVKVEFVESGRFQIQVIDSGIGVPDEFKQKIFQKYEVGTLMSDVSQIGLGLAFCKMVVEAHGGEICVKNNQPQGAIFEIHL